MNREQRRSRRALFRLLGKLGIKSAQAIVSPAHGAPLTVEVIEDMMDETLDAFGSPDVMMMSGSALNAYLALMGPSPAQVADKEGPVQSEGAPADKRDR